MPIAPRTVTPSLLQIDAILARLSGRSALDEVSRYLRSEQPHFHWLGVYGLEGSMLRLLAWNGEAPTAHETIPVGEGLCGLGAREGRTVLVGDVRERPEYLACFPETRAEVVVPVRAGGVVVGEIDVDGTVVGGFDASDAAYLE